MRAARQTRVGSASEEKPPTGGANAASGGYHDAKGKEQEKLLNGDNIFRPWPCREF